MSVSKGDRKKYFELNSTIETENAVLGMKLTFHTFLFEIRSWPLFAHWTWRI